MTYKFVFPIQVDTGNTDPSRHLAHHNHLVLFQKARQAYLEQFGYTERDIEGLRMFIVEANCVYKRELFHQDRVVVKCRVDEIKTKVFSMTYSIERDDEVCARGYTRSVCADPVSSKSVPLPGVFVSTISRYESLGMPMK
ncbi:MAG: thioesterase family protein [Pseudomonadota bacterium]